MVVLDLEFSRVDFGPREVVKAWVFHVNDAPALQANEVMMLVELGIKSSRGAGVAGLGHNAKRNKCPQDTVDCHPGNLGELVAHGTVKLLRGRVIGPAQDHLKDGSALGGNRQATFTVGREKAAHSLSLVYRTHGRG